MSVIEKAIDCVFEIMADRARVEKLDDLQKRIGFESMFFSFGAFLDCNESKLVNFLDWYFHELLDEAHPESDFGGLVSYALYDAATPYIDGKPFNLKEKSEFKAYVEERLKGKAS